MAVPPGRREPRILDLSAGSRPVTVLVDSGAAFELLALADAVANRDGWATYDQPEGWFSDLRSRLEPSVATVLDRYADSHTWTRLAAIVARAADADDVDDVLAFLADLPPSDIYRALMTPLLAGQAARRDSARLVEAAIRGGAADRSRLAEAIDDCGGEMHGARDIALVEPAQLKRDVLDVLGGVREAGRAHLDAVAPLLARDAEVLRARLQGLPVAEAIEIGTNGIVYAPEAGIGTVVLIPQVAMRPWVLIDDHDGQKIFFVAAAEEVLAAQREVPPPRLLAVMKALSEEQRLRIVRRLAVSPASLQQITDLLGSAKSTAHYHMAMLRVAGLTTVELGGDREYALRREAVDEIVDMLRAYLGDGARDPG